MMVKLEVRKEVLEGLYVREITDLLDDTSSLYDQEPAEPSPAEQIEFYLALAEALGRNLWVDFMTLGSPYEVTRLNAVLTELLGTSSTYAVAYREQFNLSFPSKIMTDMESRVSGGSQGHKVVQEQSLQKQTSST